MTTVARGRVPRPVGQDVSSRRVVLYACAAVVIIRFVYVWQPLRSDEGGYLLAARHWSTSREFLYGDFHVDRPPLLMAIFRLAALSEWDRAIRVLSIPFALVIVVAAARAAYLVAGDRAARWSAVVAAALATTPALAADQADGELFAAAFVMASVALALSAWYQPAGLQQRLAAIGAGATGVAAALVKQNFLDALVFSAVLVLAEAVRRGSVSDRCRVLALGASLGALLPILLLMAWSNSAGVDGWKTWTDLVAFRGNAFTVIWGGNVQAPIIRGLTLAALALVSAMVPIAWTWVRACRARATTLSPPEYAVYAGLLFGVAALMAGGSYWPHYLLQLTAMLSLAAGIVASSHAPEAVAMRRWAAVSAASAGFAVIVNATVYATVPRVWFLERTGEWLAESSEANDTAFVAYGAPSILETADLSSPYPFLWSLPMRTLDPQQSRLRATLAGPDAPTWVVQINGLNAWDIDDGRRLRTLIESRYDVVAHICGHNVWLRRDVSRTPASPPNC